LAILKYIGIGISVLALCCGLCACIARHQRQLGPNNQVAQRARNQGIQPLPYSFTNMGRATQTNSLQQSFTIPMSSGQVTQNQEAPPPCYSVSLSTTGNGESKI
jgi:hypothetical protein